jgi:hypothetical protein
MKTLESAPVPVGAAWLTRKRLDNLGLSRIRFRSAPEVVRWFVAVQSQDFGGA